MLTPDQFHNATAYDLLLAASQGEVGVDQRWLRALLDKPQEEVVAGIVRFGAEDRSDDTVVLDRELIAILRHYRTPEAVPYYVQLVRQDPTDVPDELVDAFHAVRDAALEPLLALYEELEEDQGGEVAFLLASFRIPDERVLRILLDRLEYDAGDGAIALGMYGDPAARPALEKLLGEVDDAHLRRDIEQALEDLGRPADDYEPPFDVFAEFPETDYPAADLLSESDRLEMLTSTSAEYRFAAVAGFIDNDLGEQAVAALLQVAKTDEDLNVRAKAWEALAPESERPEVHDAMLARLQDESAPLKERSGALVGLGPIANEQPVRRYAEQFYENPETRAEALAAMWHSLDRSFRDYFPKHLDDPDPRVQKQAMSGVGYLGITESAEKLRSFFDQPELRPNALFAYALSVRAEISPGRIRGLLRKIDEIAGGLGYEEEELVKVALDERLLLHGHSPVFRPDDGAGDEEVPDAAVAPVAAPQKVGRNEPCPCGSGKKFKKCCGAAV